MMLKKSFAGFQISGLSQKKELLMSESRTVRNKIILVDQSVRQSIVGYSYCSPPFLSNFVFIFHSSYTCRRCVGVMVGPGE